VNITLPVVVIHKTIPEECVFFLLRNGIITNM
jgi:hypothetical protein